MGSAATTAQALGAPNRGASTAAIYKRRTSCKDTPQPSEVQGCLGLGACVYPRATGAVERHWLHAKHVDPNEPAGPLPNRTWRYHTQRWRGHGYWVGTGLDALSAAGHQALA